MKIKHDRILGVHLTTSDFKTIVGLDYDVFKLEHLTNELQAIQKLFMLSNFYVLETQPRRENTKRYHAVCFDKIFLQHYRELLMGSHVDVKFRSDFNLAFGEPKVLRIGIKRGDDVPRLKKILFSNHRVHEQSTPHKITYDMAGIIPFLPDEKDDGLKINSIVWYQTNRWKVEDEIIKTRTRLLRLEKELKCRNIAN